MMTATRTHTPTAALMGSAVHTMMPRRFSAMQRAIHFSAIVFGLAACGAEDPDEATSNAPSVTLDATYGVLVESDIVYAEGLAHTPSSDTPSAIPLLLDIYTPDADTTNRPMLVFIHGGGFTGGTKTKPEIVAMGEYYASRGWVFASVDYRTTEEMGTLTEPSRAAVTDFYQGIVPAEWLQPGLDAAEAGVIDSGELQQSIAMYAAQRDAKAAVRWMVSHADTYGANPDYLTVGGASAGAITASTLGITNVGDFRDEISASDDPTVSTTFLDVDYEVRSVLSFWGSTSKLDLFQGAYGVDPFDADDPELFLAHGTDDVNPSTPFTESEAFQGIYDELGIYSELLPLEGHGHGAWHAEVDGLSLFDLSFDFIVSRQDLNVVP